MTMVEKQGPVWLDHAAVTAYPPLAGEVVADVTVVGAGITGLTAALLLQRVGQQVAVIEAGRVGGDVTGHSTAHLTAAIDTRYSQIASGFGADGARMVAQSSTAAIDLIEQLINELGIDCGFARVPGFLYSEQRGQVRSLEQELDAARSAGLSVVWSEQVPLPFSTVGAVLFHNQAQFDPVRYVQGLAQAFVQGGGKIFEQSRVVDVQDVANGMQPRAVTAGGSVRSHVLVLATHSPIHDPTFLPDLALIVTKMSPFRSYVLGVRLNGPVPQGLFWDTEDPYHYIRSAGDLLIVGGADHRTGTEPDTAQHYERLEQWTRQRFDVASVEYRWSSQWYEPADGLPYIGRSPLPAPVLVATGYSGNGTTFGTLAGMLLADEILGKANPYTELYAANRVKPLAAGTSLLGEVLQTARHFVLDRLTAPGADAIEEIGNDDGAVVALSGEKVAVYRDGEGQLHAVSAVCPHALCIVDWNSSEKSWDCPCHGSRFTSSGAVIVGPAVKPLEPLRLVEKE